MAELGAFRTGLSGFNKKDVLDYIDSMQMSHTEELNQQAAIADQLRRQLAAAEEKAAAAQESARQIASLQEENTRLQQSMDESLRFISELKAQVAEQSGLQRQVEQLTARAADSEERVRLAEEAKAEADVRAETSDRLAGENEALRGELNQLRTELEQLRRDTVPSAEISAEREQMTRRLQEANGRVADLQAENDRYTSLIGNVGELIMEVRSMGQRLLEGAFRRGEEGIEALDGAAASLESQLKEAKDDVAAAREELEEQRTAAGARLEEMVRALEEHTREKDAVSNPDEPEAQTSPSFFRWAAGRGGVPTDR